MRIFLSQWSQPQSTRCVHHFTYVFQADGICKLKLIPWPRLVRFGLVLGAFGGSIPIEQSHIFFAVNVNAVQCTYIPSINVYQHQMALFTNSLIKMGTHKNSVLLYVNMHIDAVTYIFPADRRFTRFTVNISDGMTSS